MNKNKQNKTIGWLIFSLSLVLVITTYIVMYNPPEKDQGGVIGFGLIVSAIFAIVGAVYLYNAYDLNNH